MRMRTFHWLLLGGLLLLVATACSRPAPTPESPLRPIATVKDIMDSMVDPSADILWESVSTTINAKGIVDKQPRTDEEWAMVRRSAVTLVEATNLLVMDGRHIGRSGDKSQAPQIELEPEQIEKMVNEDRAAWVTFAHALQDAGKETLMAIDAKNVPQLVEAGEKIDVACELCHLKYWYPPKSKPAAAKSQS